MGGIGRLQFKAQPTYQDKLSFLEKTYGRENLHVANIGGSDQFLYRDKAETNNKWRRVDEEGLSLADFTTDILPSMPEVAGAVAGAVKGAAVGAAVGSAIPVVGTAIGAVVGGVGGAAIGAFSVGAAQDVAVRAASGEDIDIGEIAGRKGKEALFNVGMDVLTGGGSRLVSNVIGKKVISKSANEAKEALREILTKTGGDTSMINAIPISDASAASRASRLSKSPEGLESSRVGKIHDQVNKIVEAARGRVDTGVPVEDVILREAEILRKTMKDRAGQIADLKAEEAVLKKASSREKQVLTAKARRDLTDKATEDAARESKLIDSTIDRLIKQQLKGANRLRTTAGEAVRKSVERGFANDKAVVGGLYAKAEKVMKAPIYKLRDKHSLEPIAKAFDRVMKKFNITDPAEEYQYRTLSARLGPSLADDLVTLQADLAAGKVVNFSKLNSMVRRMEGKVKRGKRAGFTEDELVINDLAKSMLKIREQALIDIGPTAKSAWETANREFRKKILPRTENVTERAGRSIAGGSDVGVTPEKLIDEAISNSQSIRQTIRSAENPTEMRVLLRGHYLGKIIDAAGNGKIDIDEAMIRSFYVASNDAKAAISRLRKINKLIEKRVVKPRSVSVEEIQEIVGTSTRSGDLAIKALEKRGRLEALQDAERLKALCKMSKGEAPIPEDIHAFKQEFVKLDARDMKRLLDRLPDQASKDSLHRSALDELIEMHSAGAQKGSKFSGSAPIFNPDSMLPDLLSNQGKWEVALGKETYQDMVRSAKVLKETPIPKPVVSGLEGRTIVPRADAGGGSGVIFYATEPVRWLARKAMDLLHGSGGISKMLEDITSSRVVDEAVFKKIVIGMMSTRRGMEALADETSKDKNLEDWLNREIGELPEEGAEQP
jgi:uncharacterized membrane protein